MSSLTLTIFWNLVRKQLTLKLRRSSECSPFWFIQINANMRGQLMPSTFLSKHIRLWWTQRNVECTKEWCVKQEIELKWQGERRILDALPKVLMSWPRIQWTSRWQRCANPYSARSKIRGISWLGWIMPTSGKEGKSFRKRRRKRKWKKRIWRRGRTAVSRGWMHGVTSVIRSKGLRRN